MNKPKCPKYASEVILTKRGWEAVIEGRKNEILVRARVNLETIIEETTEELKEIEVTEEVIVETPEVIAETTEEVVEAPKKSKGRPKKK